MTFFSRPGKLFLMTCSKQSLPPANVRKLSLLSMRIPNCSKYSVTRFNIAKVHPEVQIFQRNLNKSCISFAHDQQQRKPEAVESDNEEVDETKPYVVYEGALTYQLKRVKIFSITTSCMGLVMQPVILNSASETPLAATIAVLGMIGFFTYVTPFLIHQMAKKYVTEIIYDPENKVYTAATNSFFLMRKELKFKKDDVIVPDVPGPFTTIVVDTKDGKNPGLFIALDSFKFPVHYGILMGYDKPLDLHLSAEDVEIALKKKKEANENKAESKR